VICAACRRCTGMTADMKPKPLASFYESGRLRYL
jgi:hypothetical protein